MLHYSCLFVFLLSLNTSNAHNVEAKDTEYWKFIGHQRRLMEQVFKNYSADISPVFTINQNNSTTHVEPLEIDVKMVYLKLIGISEPEEKVTVIIGYDMTWRDLRISWNPEDFGNISYFSIPRAKLWIPQLHIVNTHSLSDFRPEYQQIALVNHDGNVTFYVANVASIVCNMEVGDFPFDHQQCEIMLVSNIYRNYEVQINLQNYDMFSIKKNLGTGEWQMLNVSAEKELLPIEGCIVELNKYVIFLKRNSIFYVSMIIVPYFVINVLSIIGMFLVRHDRLGKLTICLTNLMSTTFILSILTDSVPKTQKLSLLSVYVMINLSIMLVAVLGTIVLPLSYQRWKQNFSRGKTAAKYEQNDQEIQQDVKGYFTDKGNWNRLFFVVLQMANVLNFVFLFL